MPVSHGHCSRVQKLLAGQKLLLYPDVGLVAGPLGVFGTRSPLYYAGDSSCTDCADDLLTAGADPNMGLTVGPFGVFTSRTPLYYASLYGHTKVVAVLLKAGADPNAGYTVGPWGVIESASPLCTASYNGGWATST